MSANKISINRSFGEVILNLELPSLEKFFKTDVIQVKFFCLQVLQDLILHRCL